MNNSKQSTEVISELQQRVPLAVLKRTIRGYGNFVRRSVATARTACGIET